MKTALLFGLVIATTVCAEVPREPIQLPPSTGENTLRGNRNIILDYQHRLIRLQLSSGHSVEFVYADDFATKPMQARVNGAKWQVPPPLTCQLQDRRQSDYCGNAARRGDVRMVPKIVIDYTELIDVVHEIQMEAGQMVEVVIDTYGYDAPGIDTGGGGGGMNPTQCDVMCDSIFNWSLVMCAAVGLIYPPYGVICGAYQTVIWQYCQYKCLNP